MITDIANILLVNDSKTQQFMIQDMLIEYTVRVAETEDKLLELLDDWEVDLIIMNNVLLEGNGYRLTQKLRLDAKYDEIPIILTASLDHPVDGDRAYQVGCNSYLTKPFTREQLLETLNSLNPQSVLVEDEKAKILIVDDSKSIQTVISTPFLKANYQVRTAGDGEEALEVLNSFSPDVITIDIEMPRMNGLELCRQIRSLPDPIGGTPIIIISGEVNYDLRMKGYLAGVIEFFKKPFKSDVIFNYVDQLIANIKSKRHVRVLVIEDALLEQHIMKYGLIKAGYEPYVVGSGEEALQIVESVEFDIILLDIVLKGQNGFEISKTLRRNPLTKDIPIIVVTGLTDDASILESFNVGATDYIGKPFSPDELMARIRVNLDRRIAIKQIDEINSQQETALIQSISDKVNAILLYTDTKGNLICFSNNILKYLDIDKEQFKTDHWMEMLFPQSESRNNFLKALEAVSNKNKIEKEKFDTINPKLEDNINHWEFINAIDDNNESQGFLIFAYLK